MDKAKQILEEALSYKNCDGLIEENSRLEDAVLYAINQALRQPPVSGMCSGCDWIDIDYKVRKCVKCGKSEQFD